MTKFEEAYRIAYKEMGQHEIAGREHNARILEYHAATHLKASTDETPWCAAFMNWVLLQMKVPGTGSAAAKSFATWGRELRAPVQGCIAVLTRDGGYHVGLVDHVHGDFIYLLGGNQGDQVCISAFRLARLVGYRGFEIEVPPPVTLEPLVEIRNEKVKALQLALNGVGHNLVCDGIAGPKTKAALAWAAETL